MFTSRVNKNELSHVALELLKLLERYRSKSRAAEKVLLESKQLLKRAIDYQIDSPIKMGFFQWEYSRGGALFGIDELCDAAARFHLLLRGAKSLAYK